MEVSGFIEVFNLSSCTKKDIYFLQVDKKQDSSERKESIERKSRQGFAELGEELKHLLRTIRRAKEQFSVSG